MTQRRIGMVIVVVSGIELGLLLFLKIQEDKQLLSMCQSACATEGTGGSCSIDSCPYHKGENNSWLLGIMSVLVAFLAGIGFYLALVKQDSKKVIEEKEYDISSLNEEEKTVFHYIQHHKEGVYQSALAKEFNLSKVQVTRLMDKFEGMELIQRKRRGLTNIILLK